MDRSKRTKYLITMKFAGWQRLVAEYAKQFDVETPKPNSAQ